jgi:hypothetical protein
MHSTSYSVKTCFCPSLLNKAWLGKDVVVVVVKKKKKKDVVL